MHYSKGVALNIEPYNSYQLDHIGVMASILGFDLLTTEEASWQICRKYYPDVSVFIINNREVILEQLVQRYKAIIYSCFWPKDKDDRLLCHTTKARTIFCPHGYSDKGIDLDDYFERLKGEDIALVYGDRLRLVFETKGLLDQIATTIDVGNYRYEYYKQHQHFYDTIIADQLLSTLPSAAANILYAPTWQWTDEQPTVIQHALPLLVDNLPDHYNLIIKIHPYVKRYRLGHYYTLLGQYESL
ncbi:hypothetical protein JYU14_04300, partial [Simkania negevensis]|nr:hypothetical protein [Simkania negevensis]